jgi:hypothetical protein
LLAKRSHLSMSRKGLEGEKALSRSLFLDFDYSEREYCGTLRGHDGI